MMKALITAAVTAMLACPLALEAQEAPPARAPAAGATLTPGEILQQTSGAFAFVGCAVEDEADERSVSGQAICIDPSGVFMTLIFGGGVRPNTLKDFTLTLPGVKGKTFKAELLGIDPGTGIAFIRATEAHKWSIVRFARKSGVSVGQQVVSVGLLPGNLGGVPYLGIAYASSMIRVPGEMVYVTGGNLTNPGSPVFAMDGRAIGIVGRQLFLNYQMVINRNLTSVAMQGQQETCYFTPVEEFVSVLENPPVSGKPARLPWIGATRFDPVDKDLADTIKLDRPGVKVDHMIPGQPGAEAGLKDRDIIVAMNGKPIEELATPELVAQNFERELARMSPGQKVTLTVLRGTQTQEVTVTLGTMPMQPYEADRYISRSLGFIVRDKVMMDEYADKNPALKAAGVIVMIVGPQTAAAVGGLRPGDVVTSVNDQAVKNVAGLRQVLEGALNAKPTQVVNFLVRRGDQAQAISIQPPAKQP